MKYIICVLLYISVFSEGISTDNSKIAQINSIIEKVNNKYSQYNYMEYELEFIHKRLSSEDSTVKIINVKLFRDNSDTVYNGYIWYKESDSIEVLYDGASIYFANTHTKIAKQMDAKRFKSNISKDYIDSYFLKPFNLNYRYKDTTTQLFLEKTKLQSKNYFKITALPDDQEYVTNIVLSFWIKENTELITRKTAYLTYNNLLTQYSEWKFQKIRFENKDKKEFLSLFNYIFDNYAISVEEYPDSKRFVPLQLGTNAPKIEGKTNDGDIVLDFRSLNKLVLLDFWYLSCHPCIMAIPHLVELHKAYNGRGLEIYGINRRDDPQKKGKLMKKYIEKYNISYPIVFTDYKADSLYKVRGYPTLYLISPEGKILYSQLGFYETMNDTLRKLIEENLND